MISSPRPRSPGSRSGGRQVPSSRTVTVSTPSTSTRGGTDIGPGSAPAVGVLGGVGAGLADGDHHADPVLLAHPERGQPARRAGGGSRAGAAGTAMQVQVQRLLGRRPAVGDQHGDVVGPALRAAHPLGDRRRRGRPTPSASTRAGPAQDLAGDGGQPVEGRRRSRCRPPARAPLENSTSVAPCSSTCSGTGVPAPGRLPSGGRGVTGRNDALPSAPTTSGARVAGGV